MSRALCSGTYTIVMPFNGPCLPDAVVKQASIQVWLLQKLPAYHVWNNSHNMMLLSQHIDENTNSEAILKHCSSSSGTLSGCMMHVLVNNTRLFNLLDLYLQVLHAETSKHTGSSLPATQLKPHSTPWLDEHPRP